MQNIKNFLLDYNNAEFIITASLVLSAILFLLIFYKTYSQANLSKFNQKWFENINSVTLTGCNLLILLASWSFALIYKFPYPRTFYITIVFTALVPLNLSLIYKNSFLLKTDKK